MKFKKERVLILRHRLCDTEDNRVYIDARTTEYKGHKFNIQGTYDTGYIISDNSTGMLISNYFNTLTELKEKFSEIADKFINNVLSHKQGYDGAIARFNNAKIMEE